jgi:hypothetical protein
MEKMGFDVPRKICAAVPSSLSTTKGPHRRRRRAVGGGIDALIDAAAAVADAENADQPANLPATSSAVLKTLAEIVEGTSEAEMEIMTEYTMRILNDREVSSDELVTRIVAMVEAQIPQHLDAEEKRQTLERAVLAKLSAASSCLKLKLAPLAKAYMNQREDEEMDGLFYNMIVPQMTRREKAMIYGIMFARFMDDDDCVSFATGNPRMLGRVAAVDIWFLTFFVFVTCRRIRGDNLLQLGCTGISSCGKSTLLESVIRRTAHQLLSSSSSTGGDAGVGRFEVGKKNTILLHDITIGKLFGVDFEKIKAISRAETAVAKIHSHVAVLPPLHLFYTSNQRLQNHSIRAPSLFTTAAEAAEKKARAGSKRCAALPFLPLKVSTVRMMMASQVGESLGGLKKPHVTPEDLKAIKNRFLEMYVHKKPFQEEAHLNLNETFDRFDFIVGTFERALSVLEKYTPCDFASPHLFGYVIGALKKNSLYYEEVMKGVVDGGEAEEKEEVPAAAVAVAASAAAAAAAAAAVGDDFNNNVAVAAAAAAANGNDTDPDIINFYVDDDGHLRKEPEEEVEEEDEESAAEEDSTELSLLPPIDEADLYQQHYVRILKLAEVYEIH